MNTLLALLGTIGALIAALILAVGRGGSLKRERDDARADLKTQKEMQDANAAVDRSRDGLVERLRKHRF